MGLFEISFFFLNLLIVILILAADDEYLVDGLYSHSRPMNKCRKNTYIFQISSTLKNTHNSANIKHWQLEGWNRNEKNLRLVRKECICFSFSSLLIWSSVTSIIFFGLINKQNKWFANQGVIGLLLKAIFQWLLRFKNELIWTITCSREGDT